jgi:UDP-N-acetyl-D-mannosaminuronic acid dehydrogenase
LFLNSLISISHDYCEILLAADQKQQGPMRFNKVLVVGLGQLGLPVARYVKEKGFDDAYGYDISSNAMDRAEKTAGIKKANDFSDFDVYILCVSTHKPDDIFTPQIEGLLSIVQRISKEARRNGALVSIESTIPKGTSAKVLEILNHRLHVAHAPHRWYALEEKEHGVNQLRVVGGVCDCCLNAAMQFYNGTSSLGCIDEEEEQEDDVGNGSSSNSTANNSNNNNNNNNNENVEYKNKYDNNGRQQLVDGNGHSGHNSRSMNSSLESKNKNKNIITSKKRKNSSIRRSLGISMHPVSNVEIAELTKIAENAHRYLQIAFAEDLYLYCQASNINFSELRDALNTKWNVNILEPRDGIGGHCLPKDTRMFLQSSKSSIKSKILTAAMEVDEDYRRYREIRASKSLSSSSTSFNLKSNDSSSNTSIE